MSFIRSQFIFRTSLAAVTLAGLALVLFSCSKSKAPDEPSPDPSTVSNRATTGAASRPKAPVHPSVANTNQTTTEAATNLVNPVVVTNQPGASAGSVAATPEQVQQLAGLEKNYVAAGSFDDRFDVALAIGKTGTVEAVKMLERLFRAEKDRELRTELINALIDISGCKDEKLSLLRLGIATDQAGDTREAAIDGLIDLEDERALPLLQELTADPDEKVRAVAKHALALATELLKAR